MLVVQYSYVMRDTIDVEVMFSIPRDALVEEASEVSDAFIAQQFVEYLKSEDGIGYNNPELLINLHRVSTGMILEDGDGQ